MILTDYNYIQTGIDVMYANKVMIVICTIFLFVSLVGVSYAETKDENGTNNLSQLGNISLQETNQSVHDFSNSNSSKITNSTIYVDSTGGIKNFMKNFKYQSNV